MRAMICVERYRVVFSLAANSGKRTDRICDVNRVLGVSGKDWVSSISPCGMRPASGKGQHAS